MAAIVAMFGKKKMPAPKFADEGPPVDDSRGGAGGGDAGANDGAEPDMDDGLPGTDSGMGDAHDMALDDLADILGVSPADRDDLGNALKAYVSSCMVDSMGGDGEGSEPGAPPPEK